MTANNSANKSPAPDLREARTAFEKWAMETWLGGINLAWTESRNCYDDFATHIGFKSYVEGARAALASRREPARLDVTAEDVQAFVSTLYGQGTPWADGCARLIAKLWGLAQGIGE